MVFWFVCLFTEYGGRSKITGLSSLQISYLPTKLEFLLCARNSIWGKGTMLTFSLIVLNPKHFCQMK